LDESALALLAIRAVETLAWPASLRTTAIHGDVIGPGERAFAERMWLSGRPRASALVSEIPYPFLTAAHAHQKAP
jgi:hypothetical protein